MPKPSELNARIDELESRLAFQDHLIEHLNEVITRHDRDLSGLTVLLRELTSRLTDLADAGSDPGISSEHEVPPHY